MVTNRTNKHASSPFGGIVDPMVVNQLARLTRNVSMSRTDLVEKLLDPRRDIDHECGYPKTVDIEEYRTLYDRFGVAARVVEVLPQESWMVAPEVFETEDIDNATAFEKAWDDLGAQLHGATWHKPEEDDTHAAWEYLCRLDTLSGVGRYGVLLLAIDDGKDLREPADLKPGKAATRKLLFVRAVDESLVTIAEWEKESSNPRYGMPVSYDVTLGSDTGVSKQHRVHWTRIIHVADNLGSSEVYGTPRQKPVFNNLLALRKLYGGSAEMYWRGAFPGLSFETHPQLGGDVTVDTSTMKDQIEQYMNTVQRYLLTRGMSVKSLAPQVVDPSKQIDAHITAICIKIPCPKRIFLGSERGELASSQDDSQWNDQLRRRQHRHITPRIIVPFIDRLIQLGVLPQPQEPYSVVWPDMNALTEEQQAEIAERRTNSIAKYVQSGADTLMVPIDFLTRILGLSDDAAKEVVDNAMGYIRGDGQNDTSDVQQDVVEQGNDTSDVT